MAYKISDTAIIIESDGKAILIADEVQYEGLTIGSTVNDLDENYFTSYFPVPYSFQGSTSGYNAGGNFPQKNIIDKFPFASDANSTDVGDLTMTINHSAGASSSTHGYSSGGTVPPSETYPYPKTVSQIDQYPFASDANSVDLGNLYARIVGAGGNSSSTHGYTTGGTSQGPSTYVPVLPEQTSTEPFATGSNIIQKFAFATGSTTGINVGDLTAGKRYTANQSSTTHGYASGGSPPFSDVIEKFPFTSDGNASDVGDLLAANVDAYGQSSTTHGYVSGGNPSGNINVIQKFPFTSDANSTDVGDITQARDEGGDQSSTTHGYLSGGRGPSYVNTIDKFPFSSDANATDVGDLPDNRAAMAGAQV